MIAQFENTTKSDILYFCLAGSVNMTWPPLLCKPQPNTAGLYVIYKENVVFYVGQSSNLASRVTQHLEGHYKDADRVDVYYIHGFPDFYKRSYQDQEQILMNSETYLIQQLNPTENIKYDRSQVLEEDDLFDGLQERVKFNKGGDATLFLYNGQITFTNDPLNWLSKIDLRVQPIMTVETQILNNTPNTKKPVKKTNTKKVAKEKK